MSGFERPPAEPDKLVAAWTAWTADDELPGRTMADLKNGGLDLLLEEMSADSESVAGIFTPWSSWERGKLTPQDALSTMTEQGLGDLIALVGAAPGGAATEPSESVADTA